MYISKYRHLARVRAAHAHVALNSKIGAVQKSAKVEKGHQGMWVAMARGGEHLGGRSRSSKRHQHAKLHLRATELCGRRSSVERNGHLQK